MALDVRYGEIRSEVIAKLETQKGEMENLLDKLSNTVETLPSVMEGQALQAYMDKYEKIVKTIYSKLNVNLGDFSQQLESVCQQFENLDDDMKTQLS
ncbi:WXG100 family type VII secretion target [Coprococcus sp. CLA-AA-H212]|uniref:WXG100 family type VII secretion target n=1 Tax=Coprococcus hominis (ex Arizal et al. 2022) TaxID=2881262 RepID=A0ABS8FTS9_9FIRM|nr:WXG100 family type VII secretion target [Coprococcus hominis (ex Arizal et al. 2022)]MCC2219973.1 WXG100 family type VII secretion target [Coprococcus hominis (ex Arizal et al. 2022)]